MKRLLLVILVFFALISCNKKEEDWAYLYELENKAKLSEVKETKCFLGLNFEMSKDDYYRYMDSLISIGKIYVEKDIYCYDYVDDIDKFKLKINPKFYNDTLYEVYYVSDNKSTYLFLFAGFMKKNKDFYLHTVKNLFDDEVEDYYYFKDNMVIEFGQFVLDESYMRYTNAPIEYKIDSLEKEKAKESQNEF